MSGIRGTIYGPRILFNHQSQKDLVGRKALRPFLKFFEEIID